MRGPDLPRLIVVIGAAKLALILVVWATSTLADGFQRLEGHGGPVKGVAVSPDGRHALTASFDYSVGLWDLGTGETRWLEGHEAAANAVAFLPGGRALSAGDDFAMSLWDLQTGQAVRMFDGHKGKIIAVEPSPDGTIAATSGWDGWVGLWDLSGETEVRWLKGHKSGVNDAVFSADGSRLYTGGSDGTILVWDVVDGALMRPLVKNGFGINHLELNENAGWLAYGAVDGVVRAIDLQTDQVLADLTADRRPILALAADDAGKRLAVGDGEGYVMIIDTENWQIERDFHAAVRGPIWAIAWTPDGKRVVSGGIDDAASVWPVTAADDEVAGLLGAGERSFLRDPSEMSNGERQFARKCSICHTLTPDGARRAGPSLYGLFGRPAGTLTDYSYSDALTGTTIVWEAETIDRLFDEGPDHYTPGSKMPMQRITGPADRADLIAFLAENTGPRSAGKTENTGPRSAGETAEQSLEQTAEDKP
ncbi:MAG: c-type cytochrome [Paracoccaceae bacterium]